MAKSKSSSPIKFSLVIDPAGYFSKREITNLKENSLVKGSKNMIINDGDKVATRKGFVLDGQEGSIPKGIDSSFDFYSKQGTRILRSFQGANANEGKLQIRTEYTPGTIIWADLLSGLSNTAFNYTTWWYDTEVLRTLIFVDGTTSIRMWGGGVAYVQSNNATSITKTGTTTWAEEGFFTALSGRKITINGVEYSYTGGENTTTLTGLSALPAITEGTPVFQSVVTITSLTGVSPNIKPDLIATKENRVFYGSTKSSVVWGSKVTDYKDCGFSTPLRLPGEGCKITLDNNAVGFTQDEDNFYIFAGRDDLYKIKFILSSDGTSASESIAIDKNKGGAGQAASSQSAILSVKNGIMYFTNEKTLTWLTNIENVFTPQSLPISDQIKDDFDSFDLTGVSGIFWGNAIWIAIPRENVVYIYDFDKALWQPPQTIPVSRFSIIDNVLYGHSNSKNESYKLNTGLTDNGVTIEFAAAFAYRQFGDRAVLKQFDEYYAELYLAVESVVTCTHYYEYLGSELVIPKTVSGKDFGLVFSTSKDSNLGKDNLGKNPLNGTLDNFPTLRKTRVIWDMKKVDFFEHQVKFSGTGTFEILAHGPNVEISTNLPTFIHR